MTAFIIVSSIKSSVISLDNLTTYDPADYKFNVSQINVKPKLNQLFMIIGSSDHLIWDLECIYYALVLYQQIQQS